MSALATIVGGLGELSESELRQLYLMIGVRLGIPDVPPGLKGPGTGTAKSRNAKPSGAKKPQKGTTSKGNPKRKSQWANHPLYQEYSRLKKVVEAQAKDCKQSFNSVDTAESRAYRLVFSQWLEAKSSFRDHREGGAPGPRAPTEGKEADEEESSDEEEEAGEAPSSSLVQPKVAQSSKPSPGGSGKSRSPPGKGKA
jgi:hypothetical protein